MIESPFLDSHLERQTQVAIQALNFYKYDMNIFLPTLSIFGSLNSPALFEFPLNAWLAALLYNIFGVDETIGRLISVFWSLLSIVFFYKLTREVLSGPNRIPATLFYSLSPLGIYFGRTFMSESLMLLCSIASIYYFFQWKKNLYIFNKFTIYSASWLSLGLLVKPTTVLVCFPLLFLISRDRGYKNIISFSSITYLIIAILPFCLWMLYASLINSQFVPSSWSWSSIFTDRGGYFSWWFTFDFYKNVGGSVILLCLTPIVSILCLYSLSILNIKDLNSQFLLIWLMSVVLYFFLMPGANQGHVYYQLHILPIGALLASVGFGVLSSKMHSIVKGLKQKIVLILGLTFSLVPTHFYGYKLFADYMYDIDKRMPHTIEVSELIKDNFTSEGFVIVDQPKSSSLPLTYYSEVATWDWRWRISDKEITEIEKINELIKRGATGYVAVDTGYKTFVKELSSENSILGNYLRNHHSLIKKTPNYHIYRLK